MIVGVISIALLFPTPVNASKTVPFKNQRVGQFCKTVEIGNYVKLSNGTKLICTKDGTRARWKEK